MEIRSATPVVAGMSFGSLPWRSSCRTPAGSPDSPAAAIRPPVRNSWREPPCSSRSAPAGVALRNATWSSGEKRSGGSSSSGKLTVSPTANGSPQHSNCQASTRIG